jgi:hypothetical protein
MHGETVKCIIVSLVSISSGNSKLSLQAIQLNVKIRRNVRDYDKEEAQFVYN